MNNYLRVGDVGIYFVRHKETTHEFYFDWEDFPRLDSFKWVFKSCGGNNHYLHSSIGKRSTGFNSTIAFHRLICSFPGNFVDHINRNTKDNRKNNLRETSVSGNVANSHTHELKGIRKVRGMWQPTIFIFQRPRFHIHSD